MNNPPRPIDVLLWDCDGVLQHGRQDWQREVDGVAGRGFTRRVFEAELPALRGERSLREALTDLLDEEVRRTGSAPVTLAHLEGLWKEFDLDTDALDVLAAVRGRGVACMLATNQHDQRAMLMRRVCGYDDIVDGSYYSSEIGTMKPEPAFFEHILADVDLPPHRVGFIDDVPANVDAALALGIRAVRHDPASGAAGIVADLTELVPDLPDRLRHLTRR